MELLSRCPEKFHCPVPLETLVSSVSDHLSVGDVSRFLNCNFFFLSFLVQTFPLHRVSVSTGSLLFFWGPGLHLGGWWLPCVGLGGLTFFPFLAWVRLLRILFAELGVGLVLSVFSIADFYFGESTRLFISPRTRVKKLGAAPRGLQPFTHHLN